ncbi:MAG: ATP-binding cassette domain-containing protein, partial [Anaerolineales bacterium]|nr:ATP-binding cassette domain-containing protein [Anaerolineales bacterium]
MTDSAPFIQVTGLHKRFQMGRETVHALAGVDLALARGTFAAVIGPSGSGKSTLLYLVGGLDRPSGGRIQVAGQALDDLDENQ